MNSHKKFFVDPILKEISFDDENFWMINLVNTPEFRRLSRIRQLGVTDSIFTSATHTRLSHCLGAYEIARRFVKQMGLDKQHPYDSKVLLCSALLHDLGHGPNSHAFEKYTGINHEEFTKRIILDKDTNINKILIANNVNPQDVVDVLFKKYKAKWATELIDSQIDADRMDYLMRDSWYTGAAYGQINNSIIIRGAKLIDGHIYFEEKMIVEVENLLIGRFHMYERVYNNPNSIKIEFVLSSIFKRIKDLTKQGYEFVDTYKLKKIFNPWLNDSQFTIKEFLKLDDFVFSSFIESLKEEKDEILKKLLSAYEDISHVQMVVNGTDSEYNELLKKYGEYFVDTYVVRPLRLYTNDPDPINIVTKDNEIGELSTMSKIISKLKDVRVKLSYIFYIK